MQPARKLPITSFLPKSIRGRYLVVAVLISGVLLVIAVAGWRYVKQTTGLQVQRIQQRAEATDAIGDLDSQIRNLEASLHKEIIQPGEVNSRILARHFRYLRAATDRLLESDWVKADPVLRALGEQLEADNDRLERKVQNLLNLRRNITNWFPAVGTMQKVMQPNYQRFSTQVRLAIEESETNNKLPEQTEIYKLLVAVRHASVRLVSEFRLLVANRFGIFSSQPNVAMQTRIANVNIFSREVSRLLAELGRLDKSNKLGIQQHESLQAMNLSFQRWSKAYKQVEEMLYGKNWRTDLPVLRNTIAPLIRETRQRISTIRLELAVGSARDITQLTKATKQLSDFVIFLAVAIMLLLFVGFLVIRQTLLVPIGKISSALKSEAHGKEEITLPKATTDEARDLVEAFDEMRNQVRQRQAHLDFLAHHDPLTDLPNRVLFRDRLQNAINRVKRQNTRASLMFLDLDRFKQINDSLGHNTGDKLLQMVADRLTRHIRHVDTVARLGGDEFAIIIEDVSEPSQVAIVAEKILSAIDEHFEIESRQLHVTTSIGIATCPDDGTEVNNLIKNADTAMYHSKENGPNGFTFYSAEMTARMTEFFSKELALREAIVNEEFVLYYQPIIDAKSGSVSGCEALLRWRHPEKGILAPAEFLDVLEDTDLITPVTKWVINQALCDFKQFLTAKRSQFTLSINISARLLEEQLIIDTLRPALLFHGIHASKIILEITEDTLVKRSGQAEKFLTALKDLGVRIAIDDFGKGQSSLNRLRRFPIDVVKIDKEFVCDVPTDAYDSELVTAVIAMAHSLKKHVIAEGVESSAQYDFLLLNNCDAVQGYLFSKPVSADSLVEYLSERTRRCS